VDHSKSHPSSIVIRRLDALPDGDVGPLVAESVDEGFRFLTRLLGEWEAGTMRFDGPGEMLLGVYRGSDLVAVGGLTRDPFDGDDTVGRLRRVYVSAAVRRQGLGRRLVAALEDRAIGRYRSLVLRTDTVAAARFYESLGYVPLPPGGTATHRRVLAAPRTERNDAHDGRPGGTDARRP
jgi:GNAT superfamily N-acetyltransferase